MHQTGDEPEMTTIWNESSFLRLLRLARLTLDTAIGLIEGAIKRREKDTTDASIKLQGLDGP